MDVDVDVDMDVEGLLTLAPLAGILARRRSSLGDKDSGDRREEEAEERFLSLCTIASDAGAAG